VACGAASLVRNSFPARGHRRAHPFQQGWAAFCFRGKAPIGAGIEWAFANNWTLKGEYMFIGTDNSSPCGFVLGGPVIPAKNYCWNHSGPDGISTAKIGLNYRFSGLFGGVAAFVGPY